MALGQEAAEQLWQELVGGYNLNVRLLALLGHPLDIHGQEEAMAMSQELSRVFMVSLFTLKLGDSSRVAGARTMAPEATSTGQCSLAKDKRICSGEEVAPHRKSRGDEVTKNEITASPHRNGYRWKKYGQKNIRDRKFPRFYYSCTHSHGRGCRAKKRVQQEEDNSGAAHPPMFQVTYVNEHTCHHQVLPSQDISTATNLPATNSATTTRNGAHFDPAVHVGDNAGLEDEIMICTLNTVIGGVPSPPPVEASQLSDPSSYVPPRLLDVSMGGLEHETTVGEMGFSCGSPFLPVAAPAAPSSSSSLPPLLPVEASSSCPAGRGNLPSIDDAMTMEEMYFACGPLFSPVAAQSITHWDDGPMAVAGRYTDTASASAWPQFS